MEQLDPAAPPPSARPLDRFLGSWFGVAVVFTVLAVVVAAFAWTGQSATASGGSAAAAGPVSVVPTSVVIGDVPASGGSGTAPDAPTTNAGCANAEATTSPIAGDEIVIGSSVPSSGPYASFGAAAKGFQAFIDQTNADGGVSGKRIKLIVLDDGYDPATTKANVRRLVDDDKVFALFNIVGEANNLSVRADLDRRCIPDLFAASESSSLGTPDRYPWTIGSSPTPAIEATVIAGHLGRVAPEAKVGILRQNDTLGLAYATSFATAVKGTGIEVVSEQSYDLGQAGVQSQLTKLRNAGADTVVLAGDTPTCARALTGIAVIPSWGPRTYVVSSCATKQLLGLAGPDADGVLSAFSMKDPRDPRWVDDEAMRRYRQAAGSRGVDAAELDDPLVAYGWTMGELLVQTLRAAPTLSRRDVMNAAYHARGLTPGLLLPRLSVVTDGSADAYPIEGMAIGKWNGRFFAMQGDVLNYEGRTSELAGASTAEPRTTTTTRATTK